MYYVTKLKRLRELKKASQKDIAAYLEISNKTYSHYENQENIIPIKHLVKLSEYFNVSIDYLLDFTPNKQYKNNIKVDNLKSGLRLKEFRKENNLTQKELANLLNTTFSSIAWNEKGRNLIATPFLYTICKKYHISADYLLGKIDSPKYLKN